MVFDIRENGRAFRNYVRKTDLLNVPNYTYQPLSSDNNKLRVITIIPGSFESKIRFRLSRIRFDAKSSNRYPYEALSYAWGDANDRAHVYIVSSLRTRRLEVTRNCEEALRYLRHLEKPRVLWIDAICINQGDLDERARQVSIMASIFAKASQVIVWLGPASDNRELAMEWIDRVGSEVAIDPITREVLPVTGDTTRVESRKVLASQRELEAFASLFDRNYFDRLWVWQEIRMGKDRVMLKCGKQETLLQILITANLYYLIKALDKSGTSGRIVRRLNFLNYMPLIGAFSSLQSLDRTRSCQCTDQRDRIYTSLAFGEPFSKELQLTPDYTSPVPDVFTDFALQHLTIKQDLEILKYVADASPCKGATVIQNLPSWVPDWTRCNTSVRFAFSNASAGSRASIKSADKTRLTVQGIVADTVQGVTQFGYDMLTEFTVRAWYRAIRQCLNTAIQSTPTHEVLAKLTRTLTNRNYAEATIPRRYDLVDFEQCENFLMQLTTVGKYDGLLTRGDGRRVLRSFDHCKGLSFFTTANGRMGLGSSTVQIGDVLAVLLGCSQVVVLRPLNENASQYSVVGNASCPDLMAGEALLGPLPDFHEPVWVYQKARGFFLPALRNKQTVSVQYEDPRLPPLSDDWQDISDEFPDYPLIYRNKVTGEVRGYQEDPRLDAHALEERGVKFQEFCLV